MEGLLFELSALIRSLKILIIFFIVQILLIFTSFDIYITFLFGPIILSAASNYSVRTKLLHFLPFIVTLILFSIFKIESFFFAKWKNPEYFYVFKIGYTILCIISLIIYSTIFRFRNIVCESLVEDKVKELFFQFYQIGYFISFIIFLSLVQECGYLSELVIHPLLITIGLNALALFLVIYFIYSTTSVITENNEVKAYKNQQISDELFQEYEKILLKKIQDSTLYLNADLSLQILSEETGIPKHHLSQLLNIHLGKSFYSFIAEYRINFSLNLLANYQLKLDVLAFESGFNSKSSYNRYFKQFIGCTPSEYRTSLMTANLN
jgi:AraC-like DNA-binding protein